MVCPRCLESKRICSWTPNPDIRFYKCCNECTAEAKEYQPKKQSELNETDTNFGEVCKKLSK